MQAWHDIRRRATSFPRVRSIIIPGTQGKGIVIDTPFLKRLNTNGSA